MAESNIGGQMSQAAETAIFKALGKWLVPGICTIAMSLAGGIGWHVIDQQDQMARSLVRVQIDMAGIKSDVAYLKERVKP